MINIESLAQRYLSLFKGKTDTYVKNELPAKKDIKIGQKNSSKRITQVREEINAELIVKHLSGEFGVGMCPVTTDGTCYYGVIDIDYYQPPIIKMLQFIRDYQLPLVPFRSKSGGLHVYFFVKKPISAKSMQDALYSIVEAFSLDKLYGEEKVEIFPKQTTIKDGGFGSAVTLPYFNCEDTYTYLIDAESEPASLEEAIKYVENKKSSLTELEEALEALPYQDAPVCIQRILLTHAVGGEDSGRNNFLFNFAVYAKKKYGDDFGDYVKEINRTFEYPKEEEEVETLIDSVKNNEYIYQCSNIPCKGFCNKKLCKNREFSHLNRERNKGHFTGIDFGQLYRYMTAEPYYVWDLRLVGQEEWKKVVFRSEKDLRNQDVFSDMCMRYLKVVPFQVSKNDWASTLNTVLPNSKDIAVKEEYDTSAVATIREAFRQFLANKQCDRKTPAMIKLGLCYRAETENGYKYYFTHEGFEKYLTLMKFNFDTKMMHNTLLSYGVKEDTLVYKNPLGREMALSCWSKMEDKALQEAHEISKEIEFADKQGLGAENITSVSEQFETSEKNTEEEAPYTEEDFNNVKDML